MTIKCLYQIVGTAVSQEKIISLLCSESEDFNKIINSIEDDEDEIHVQIQDFNSGNCEGAYKQLKNGLELYIISHDIETEDKYVIGLLYNKYVMTENRDEDDIIIDYNRILSFNRLLIMKENVEKLLQMSNILGAVNIYTVQDDCICC